MIVPRIDLYPQPRRERDSPAWILERRAWELRRILEAGRWTIHDIVNRRDVRQAVSEQWRLLRLIELDRDVEATLGYLERLERLPSQI